MAIQVLPQPILDFLQQEHAHTIERMIALAEIPSPSNHEEAIASFIQQCLHEMGFHQAYIDQSSSVICPIGDFKEKKAVLFCAHIDTVFTNLTEIHVKTEHGKLYAPGIGDNSANVAALLTIAKMIQVFGLKEKQPILLAFSSGEEGLGNLKGIRSIMDQYASCIDEMVAVDGGYRMVVNQAVGSRRYRVSVAAPGGHSYGDFGNENAIASLAHLIELLYQMPIPTEATSTYNVGKIQGGTSVNTIAQSAEMLFEMRSESQNCLDEMDAYFKGCIQEVQTDRVIFQPDLLGERPCACLTHENTVLKKLEQAAALCAITPQFYAASTDANLPLSFDIPSIAFGTYLGSGAHTLEEHLDPDSMHLGMKLLATLIYGYFTSDQLSKDTTEITVVHHAVMIAAINQAIMQTAGNNAETFIEQCMREYGISRGQRMAEKAQSCGYPLDLHSYNAYRQWSCALDQSVSVVEETAPDYRIRITRCPWNETWQKYGLQEFGRYYCEFIDEALMQGFNDQMDLKVGKTLSHGAGYCDFCWKDANYQEKMQQSILKRVGQTGLMTWKEMVSDLCNSCSNTLKKLAPQLASVILQRAWTNFEEIFSNDIAAVFESDLQI